MADEALVTALWTLLKNAPHGTKQDRNFENYGESTGKYSTIAELLIRHTLSVRFQPQTIWSSKSNYMAGGYTLVLGQRPHGNVECIYWFTFCSNNHNFVTSKRFSQFVVFVWRPGERLTELCERHIFRFEPILDFSILKRYSSCR